MVTALALSFGEAEFAHGAVIFSGSGTGQTSDGPGEISASATFSLSGGDLQVTLSNTSTDPTSDPANELIAILFHTADAPSSLSLVSQYLPGTVATPQYQWNGSSSTKYTSAYDLPSNEQWSLPNNTLPSGYNTGIGGAGLNYFGSNPKIGIVSPTYAGAGHGSIGSPFQDSLTFDIAGYTGNLSDISAGKVEFLFGTGTGGSYQVPGTLESVPEANFGWAAALLVIPIGLQVLKRKNHLQQLGEMGLI